MQHEIEEAALKKENSRLSAEHLAEIQKELTEMREQFQEMKARWENEKASIGRVQKLREEIEQVGAQIELAEREYDLDKAAALKYGKLPELQKQLNELEENGGAKETTLLRDKVTEEEIARIVGRWTGIPVSRLMEGEREKLLHLDRTLHQRVIGQDEAVSAVSRAIRRARAGLKDPKRPIGSFIFLGPTGVGKTELCRALGEAMFGDEDSVIRVDMSEYMEKHTTSRLVGSPPGYVGYEEGGQLTEAVRSKPYSVVLLDEVEKAHPDVFNILLQILEDGRLTDNTGRVVSFKNTIIVMTSNAGAHSIDSGRSLGFGSRSMTDVRSYETMKETVMKEVKELFRPEFINRVDELIVFHPLETSARLPVCSSASWKSAWRNGTSTCAMARTWWRIWPRRALTQNMARVRCAG